MLRHHLLLSWRVLLRSKLYSSINIIGLAAGMAVAMLIGLWVRDELSFNHYHRNHERLANILSIWSVNGEVSVEADASVPLAAELHSTFPADFKDMALVSEGGHLLTSGDKKIQQWGMWAQSGFPVMFSLRLSKGSPATLKDPNSLLLAQSLATSLFGDVDPINKQVLVDAQTVMKVGGVYEDLPENSRFYGTSYLLAWDNKANRGTTPDADWSDHHFELYVQLADQASFDKTTAKIKDITKPYLRGSPEEIGLHPMDQWRLYDEFRNGKVVGGRIRQVRLFVLIGCFVLLLACINFMNLSTARSGQRAKEVGLRKAIGLQRRQLIGQFLGESLLMTILAMLLAVGLMIVVFPLFDRLSGKQLTFPWDDWGFWLAVLCFTAFTGLAAGSYPAFYLSHFKPVKVLSGSFKGAGESILWHGESHPIVGVITDMVMESPYMPVQPTFFTLLANRRIHVITIRIKPTLLLTRALAAIQSVFRKYDPASPFDFAFTDEAYSHKFLAEEQMGNLAGFFTILAVFISCLGLFGLASFTAEQRTREIGIRKVLGATVFQLWGLLSKESVLLVSLSFGIAAPIAWFSLQDWLRAYAYRTPVAWWIFAVTGIGALVLTLSVVSVQTIRAALLNPVKSFKIE